jgi:hypothetical protein
MRVLLVPAPHAALIWSVTVPADGTSAANSKERRLRCVPVLRQLSDKTLLACEYASGVL